MKLVTWSSLLLSSVATASFAAEEKPQPFAMDAELGALVTSGNTQSKTFTAKVDVKQDFSKWRHNYLAEAIFKEDEVQLADDESEDQTTAEKYGLSFQSDYKLNEKHRGLFIFGAYEEDRFSGYDYQGTLAAGYTDRFLKTEKAEWNYSVGAGVSFDKGDDFFDADTNQVVGGESNDSAIIRLAFNYKYAFSKNAKFTQTFSSDVATESDANSKTKAVSAITANLNSSFAMRVSLSITNNSEVPDGIENTDTQTSLAIVYSL